MNIENFCLHESTKKLFDSNINELLKSHPKLSVTIKVYKPKRSLSQNNLSHKWYSEISKYLIQSGRTWMTEEKVKSDLKATFLGYEEIEQTNFVTGEITVREQLRQTSKLDTGDMYQYMTKIEAWCAQFGLQLTIPHTSEYMKLKEQQER
ncbi:MULTISPECIES: recombination protein NinB [unclassified Providencia]|uniref:recombination protein NinB n=1 Tax=unclassified Providencia TaxID=2633465 RepID=UPI0012B66DFD|nr:recombination protein NinB [Providencia sp. PROV211]MTC21839.1 hypothetical protein [Providencia sp. wls1938]